MSKRLFAAAVAAALVGLGGWALAQQAQQNQSGLPATGGGASPPAAVQVAPPGPGVIAQPGGRPAPGAAPGRFAVVRLERDGAVLVDTATGKTWELQRSRDGRAAWVPLRRLDSDKDVRTWQQERDAGRAAARDRERDLLQEVDRARREAQVQEEQARRALEEARRRLEELQRSKERETPK